jgi:NAD(P) transhydrogenase
MPQQSQMPQQNVDYDLVVIGGGPAGIVAAASAASHHKRVALIDQHRELGGAGINTGTVPSKTLRETALALSGVRSRNLYGVDLSLRRNATVEDFLRHEHDVTAALNASIPEMLRARNAEVFVGSAAFVDPHRIRVTSDNAPDVLLQGQRILIATGSAPVRPANFPFDVPGIYDSDTILKLDSLPKKMAVIGGGVIGSEYACIFGVLGIDVHLIDGRDVLLPFLDAEISTALQAAMARAGVTFHWNQRVDTCLPAGTDTRTFTLTMTSGEVLSADAVLVAAGRKSNVENLNLAAAGITPGKRGLLVVDENFRTAVPHIYAAGDVIGFTALASTSMEQARQAVHHALSLPRGSHLPKLLPTGVYTIPEASMIGATEADLSKAGILYLVGRARYRDNPRGRIIGDEDGFLKLIFHRETLKLLGAHVIGEQATELIHIAVMAMLTDQDASLFEHACFNIPTLGWLYKTATINALLTLEQ